MHSSKLLNQYAKACEKAEKFEEAALAYLRAHDDTSLVRLCLEKLAQPERAFKIVRESLSAQGAELVAEHCRNLRDQKGAVEFLLKAKKTEEAFEIAKANEIMEYYVKLLGQEISLEEAMNVAHYYEKRRDLGQA